MGKPEPKKEGPTKAQIESWTKSITDLLGDPEGREAILQFLKDKENEKDTNVKERYEGSTSYMSFYNESEAYKSMYVKAKEKAHEIYNKHIKVTAEKKVATGESETIKKRLDEGLKDEGLFDKAQDNVKKIMEDRLWYSGFCEYLNNLKIKKISNKK
ncbi:uncharacterized protein LOC126983616 [Eriocheir sinensis]|uniref:uncharacterized protein LOC126983616 n=1 Tax=Eriocheir sinensis TaxID=95602 RepID=UPI0021C60886|nr:uncharacterized protein LOC126983616 [Eriocheir sinensis]